MKKGRRILSTIVTVIILCTVVLVAPTVSVGKSPTTTEGFRFDVGISVKETLKSLVGKDVHVHLRSGKTLQGYVKSVGDVLVHLEKLAGRDFFDALVRIEDISAIEVKFRDFK